jgi:hypothetical protein
VAGHHKIKIKKCERTDHSGKETPWSIRSFTLTGVASRSLPCVTVVRAVWATLDFRKAKGVATYGHETAAVAGRAGKKFKTARRTRMVGLAALTRRDSPV